MFKWRVYSYSNVNWKEKRFEKEFENLDEYNDFIDKNPKFDHFEHPDSHWIFESFLDFNNYLDKFFHSKVSTLQAPVKTISADARDDYNLPAYENELQKIEHEKMEKRQRKASLEETLANLKSYHKVFKNEGREDMTLKIEEDIKKVEKELASFKS